MQFFVLTQISRLRKNVRANSLVFIIISTPVLACWVRKRKRLLSQPNYQSRSIGCLNLLSYTVNIQILISNQLVPKYRNWWGFCFLYEYHHTNLPWPPSVLQSLYDNSPNHNLCNVITGGQILCITPKATVLSLTQENSINNWIRQTTMN